ncbi:MAG TPA: hypothetical protein VKU90_16355 [Caulobacteraceae bacterium]|nr:hypothetical protein [Caulobacteraceae bacterium]
MQALPGYALALLAAYAFTILDLWATLYQRTFGFLIRCPAAHLLALMYGLCALLMLFAFDPLIAPLIGGGSADEKAAVTRALVLLHNNPWLKGLLVGAAANGLVNIKFFSVPGPKDPIPIGLQTLTLPFDPPLNRVLVTQHFLRLVSFCDARLAAIRRTDADLPVLKDQAKKNIPSSYSSDDQAVIQVAFDSATSARNLLRAGVERLGSQWVQSTFK